MGEVNRVVTDADMSDALLLEQLGQTVHHLLPRERDRQHHHQQQQALAWSCVVLVVAHASSYPVLGEDDDLALLVEARVIGPQQVRQVRLDALQLQHQHTHTNPGNKAS